MKIVGYRNIGSKKVGKYGTFYNVQKPTYYDTYETILRFKKPLIIKDTNVYNFEGLSLEYLFWKWFSHLSDDYIKLAKKQKMSSGEFIDKMVTEEAIRRGYDGIIMADLEIVDLRTHYMY